MTHCPTCPRELIAEERLGGRCTPCRVKESIDADWQYLSATQHREEKGWQEDGRRAGVLSHHTTVDWLLLAAAACLCLAYVVSLGGVLLAR